MSKEGEVSDLGKIAKARQVDLDTHQFSWWLDIMKLRKIKFSDLTHIEKEKLDKEINLVQGRINKIEGQKYIEEYENI